MHTCMMACFAVVVTLSCYQIYSSTVLPLVMLNILLYAWTQPGYKLLHMCVAISLDSKNSLIHLRMLSIQVVWLFVSASSTCGVLLLKWLGSLYAISGCLICLWTGSKPLLKFVYVNQLGNQFSVFALKQLSASTKHFKCYPIITVL